MIIPSHLNKLSCRLLLISLLALLFLCFYLLVDRIGNDIINRVISGNIEFEDFVVSSHDAKVFDGNLVDDSTVKSKNVASTKESNHRFLRIALFSTLSIPLPTKGYGGTERIVYYLIEEFVRMGHKVLFNLIAFSNFNFKF